MKIISRKLRGPDPGPATIPQVPLPQVRRCVPLKLRGRIPTNKGGDLEIVDVYEDTKEYLVYWHDSKYVDTVPKSRVHKRGGLSLKNVYKPSVWGVGVIGCRKPDYTVRTLWQEMLRRTYSPQSEKEKSSYADVYVSPRWLFYPNFAEDIKLLPGYDLWVENPDSYHVDKDYLNARCYDVSTCVFLSTKHNSTLIGKSVMYYGRCYTNLRELVEVEGVRAADVRYQIEDPTHTEVYRPEGFRVVPEIPYIDHKKYGNLSLQQRT